MVAVRLMKVVGVREQFPALDWSRIPQSEDSYAKPNTALVDGHLCCLPPDPTKKVVSLHRHKLQFPRHRIPYYRTPL